MKKSQIDIFGQSFYWKFQAPNKDELSTFVSAQESGDPVPWGNPGSYTHLTLPTTPYV